MARCPLSVRLAQWSVASAMISWWPRVYVDLWVGHESGLWRAKNTASKVGLCFIAAAVALMILSIHADWREGPDESGRQSKEPDPKGERLVRWYLAVGIAAVIGWQLLANMPAAEAR